MRDASKQANRRIRRLIAFGVILYAIVMNIDRVGRALTWVLGVLSPILIGLVIALILDVPMHGFQKLLDRLDGRNRLSDKLKSAVSLVLAVICVPLLLFVLLRFIVPQFASAITNVISIVQRNEQQIGAFIEGIGLDPNYILTKLRELGGWIGTNLTTIAGTAVTTAIDMFASISDIVLAIILAIYILADKAAIRRRAAKTVYAFLPEKPANYMNRCVSMFISTFRTFLACQCLEAVILGALILICMLIFRLPYAATIAGMTALLALIPYVGAYLSLGIGCILIITISPMKALIFIVLFLVCQQVEGNLIYPRVVGKSVGLPAYVTLAAVMVGGGIAGIAGMFFVIPIASVCYVLLRETVQRRSAKRNQAEAPGGEA